MATNWTVLAGVDIRKVLDASAQFDTNQNLSETTAPGDQPDITLANRRDECVAQAVKLVRGAIQTAGRYPVAITASSVPPEGEMHTLVIAGHWLVSSTPGLAKEFYTSKDSAFLQRYNEAQAWVKSLREGGSFTDPTDPTGADYVLAPNDDRDAAGYNPTVSGVRWGDGRFDDADYTAGSDEDGHIAVPQDMNTD